MLRKGGAVLFVLLLVGLVGCVPVAAQAAPGADTPVENGTDATRYTLHDTTSGVSFPLAPGESLHDLGVPAGEYDIAEFRGDERVGTFRARVAPDGTVTELDGADAPGVTASASDGSAPDIRMTVGQSYEPYPQGSTVNVSVSAVNDSGPVPTLVGGEDVTVTVTDSEGSLVLQETVTTSDSGPAVVPIDTGNIPEGEYTVETNTSDQLSFDVGPSVHVTPRFTDQVEVGRSVDLGVALSERGDPVADTVNLSVTRADGTRTVRTLTTGPDGFATLTLTPQQAGDISVYPADRPGSGTTLTASDIIGQVHTNGEDYSTYMPAGKSVQLTGYVTDDGAVPAAEELVVRVFNTTEDYDGTPVTNITTVTDPFGQFAVEWDTPDVPGAEFEARLFEPDGTRISNDGGRINLEGTGRQGGDGAVDPTLDVELHTPTYENIVAPGDSVEGTVRAAWEAGMGPIENATVRYAVLYNDRVVAANGTVTTNASGEARISVPVGADAPDRASVTVLATLTNHSVSTATASADGRLQRYRIEETRTGGHAPGDTAGLSLTFRDAATGDSVSDVPMMLSAEAADALHGSVFATGTDTSSSNGTARVTATLPQRMTEEFLYGAWYPYADSGFPTEPVDGFDVTVNGVPDGQIEAGEDVTFNYTAAADGPTAAVVSLETYRDGLAPSSLAVRLPENEDVTVSVPPVAEDTDYTVRVRAINESGVTATASEWLDVNGSGPGVGADPAYLVDGDADGDDAYATIQAAVDDAPDGATVTVEPGTYHEQVTLDKNVTLVAPDGATLDGTTPALSEYGTVGLRIAPRGDAGPVAPTVRGISVVGYDTGIRAGANTITEPGEAATGDWVIEDVSVRDSLAAGIEAYRATGDWRIRDSTVHNTTYEGIHAGSATGTWAIAGTTITDAGRSAIRAINANSAWTVRDVTIRDGSQEGIDAGWTTSDWTVRDATIENNSRGIDVVATSGDWLVTDSRIRNNDGDGVSFELGDQGVDPASGNWTVTESAISGNGGAGVAAVSVNTTGDATRNYWGAADGPSGDFDGAGDEAVGNVTVEPFYTDAEMTTLSGESATAPDCSAVSYAGSGTAENPYQVGTLEQLQCIEDWNLSADYVLTSDIDASETANWNDGKGFDPVGTGAYGDGASFTGTFDGDGHTIAGLSINRSDRGSTGLFGGIGEGGVVGNVTLDSVNVARGGAAERYSDYTGGLVGMAHSRALVHAVSVSGTVSGDRSVGGVVGYLNGSTLLRSASTAAVSGSDGVGGLVGRANDWELYDGPEVNNATIQNSYAAGAVSGDSEVGGLVSNFGGVHDSYWDELATGQAASGGGTGLTTAQMTGEAAVSNMTGLDFESNWTVREGDYPALAWQTDDDDTPDGDDDAPESGTGLDFDPTNATVQRGETVTVDVTVDTNKSVYGATTVVEYDTETLNATSVAAGGFLAKDGADTYEPVDPVIDDDAGRVELSVSRQSVTEGVTGEGVLATLTFEVAPNATPGAAAALGIGEETELVSPNAESVPFNASAGSVNVARPNVSVGLSLPDTVLNVGQNVTTDVTASADVPLDVAGVEWPDDWVQATPETTTFAETFEYTPSGDTWNGSGYETRNVTAEASAAGVTAADSVPVRVHIAGDVTGDGEVDIFDAVAVGTAWDTTTDSDAYSPGADLTSDGAVGVTDAAELGRHWGNTA